MPGQTKPRFAANIDGVTLERLKLEAEKEERSISDMARVMLKEAFMLRECPSLEYSPQQIERMFGEWGREKVKGIAVAAILYLCGNGSGSGDNAENKPTPRALAFLRAAHAGRKPTNAELVALAHESGIDGQTLAGFANAMIKSRSGSNLGATPNEHTLT